MKKELSHLVKPKKSDFLTKKVSNTAKDVNETI